MNAPIKQLSVARGGADDLGTIVSPESHTLAAIADLFRQAQSVKVSFTHAELSEDRTAVAAAKAEYEAAKASGTRNEQLMVLRHKLTAPKARLERKKRTPWINFATYKDSRRRLDQILTSTAFQGDADRGAQLELLIDRLDALGCSYIVHTSTSHGCEGEERYRVVVPFATPLTKPPQ